MSPVRCTEVLVVDVSTLADKMIEQLNSFELKVKALRVSDINCRSADAWRIGWAQTTEPCNNGVFDQNALPSKAQRRAAACELEIERIK